jgi:hypothetical protein
LASVELIEMADRIKVFPLAVLGTMVVFGLLVWWVVARAKSQESRVPLEGADPSSKPLIAPRTKIQASAAPPVEAPPPASNPGEKILEGADKAYETEFFETALMFYKDFELRYAGSETYDRHQIRVFERIHTSAARMPKKDEALPAYLDARRKAADEWKRLKPLTASPPTEHSRAELKKFRDGLPAKDGRIAVIDAWLGDK